MKAWQQFQTDAPELAARVLEAFGRSKHCTMATIRADGGPRISGTEVEISDDGVFLGMGVGTRKQLDLARDPRVAVHSPTVDPTSPKQWAGEAKFSGTVRQVETPSEYPPEGMRYEVEVTSVVFTALTEAGDALQIRLWRPSRGVETMVRS